MPSFAQAKDPMPTFDLDRIIELGAGTEPGDRNRPECDRTE